MVHAGGTLRQIAWYARHGALKNKTNTKRHFYPTRKETLHRRFSSFISHFYFLNNSNQNFSSFKQFDHQNISPPPQW